MCPSGVVPLIHQIVQQNAQDSPWRLEGKCGASARRRGAQDNQPEGFSAWTSDVNCDLCLAGIRDSHLIARSRFSDASNGSPGVTRPSAPN